MMTIQPNRFLVRLITAGEVVRNALSIFMFGPRTYHPHKHYMRGSGPKWRAKHGIVQVLSHDEVRN
jgi:hypothetical protein